MSQFDSVLPVEENLDYMNPEEIKAWKAYEEYPDLENRSAPLIKRMQDVGQYVKGQAAGRRWPVGCVSLEITQRCNLDCTLCYLSEHSEAVKDIPIQEIYRRIDVIYRHYGKDTDIQISGGDPTLRDRKELVSIVKRIHGHGMQCSLFTNGIKASRDLLTELASVGLTDVAFHVDLTQERRGYPTEASMNPIRLEYMERALGLGLNIFFNTTVHAGNFKQIPELVRFFRQHADKVDLASFQIQADTGRGVLRERDFLITQNTVIEQIEEGAGTRINFDVPMIGHPKCNKKAVMFEIAGNLYNMSDTKGFVEEMISVAPPIDRAEQAKTTYRIIESILKRPRLWPMALRYAGDLAWQAKTDLIRAKGKVNKLTFFIHNFMDACKLEKDRINGCVFMVASQEGPISMCMHNAKRDEYILKPFKVATPEGDKLFQPLTGTYEALEKEEELNSQISMDPAQHALKHLKGRSKKVALAQKEKLKETT
jgi:molybdenum cofactor biosynthesis enzyme MoaA